MLSPLSHKSLFASERERTRERERKRESTTLPLFAGGSPQVGMTQQIVRVKKAT